MSALLDSAARLDAQRAADLLANDEAMRTFTHAYGWPTVRSYPRTLAEAFPCERAQAVEPHIAPPLLARLSLFFRRLYA